MRETVDNKMDYQTENAQLQAEVKRLQAELAKTKGRLAVADSLWQNFKSECERLRAENARLAESLAEWEEKEGSCCPENTSFVTVIERLRAENARLAAALNFIFMECDWEEGKGDDRIGDACLKHRDNGKCLSDLLAPTIELLRDMLLRPQEHNPARLNRLVKELTRLRSLAGTTGRG